MTVGEVMTALAKLPLDEELFVRTLDSDGEPMTMLALGKLEKVA